MYYQIGHLEATAGFAGLIKAIYILERGVIPPNINLINPNPRIPFRDWNLKVAKRLEQWPTKGPRVISVCSHSLTIPHRILTLIVLPLIRFKVLGMEVCSQEFQSTGETKILLTLRLR